MDDWTLVPLRVLHLGGEKKILNIANTAAVDRVHNGREKMAEAKS